MSAPEIRFCRVCGTAMERRIPPMEDRLRPVCPACGYVDYVNPINVVGTIPTWNAGRTVLLCRRNIEPRKYFWTLPGGFLELGESISDGAERETREEAGARVHLQGLFTAIDVIKAGQLHLFFRASLDDLDLSPGIETIENKLFDVADIPWEKLAFRTVRLTLRHYLDDLERGEFSLHRDSIS
ncbi:NUDIX hydrolase [Aestuariimicrobium soli]|uniref:NUDIX hydrolase n=1 Tax=Aestuariimicrobium soli TaxID=2035834 RepID=UPI003EBA749B